MRQISSKMQVKNLNNAFLLKTLECAEPMDFGGFGRPSHDTRVFSQLESPHLNKHDIIHQTYAKMVVKPRNTEKRFQIIASI